MQTITLRERVGDDGILRLQMPVEPRGAFVEIVVVIQPSVEANSNSHAAKRTSFADFAGALQDETFEIPEERRFKVLNQESQLNAIHSFLTSLKGNECVKVVSGVGTWFDIYLSDENNGIFIREAAWRLERNGISLCSSATQVYSALNDEPSRHDIVTALVTKKLLDVKIGSSILDLFLHFTEGFSVKIFCQGTDEDEDYHLRYKESLLVINAHHLDQEQE